MRPLFALGGLLSVAGMAWWAWQAWRRDGLAFALLAADHSVLLYAARRAGVHALFHRVVSRRYLAAGALVAAPLSGSSRFVRGRVLLQRVLAVLAVAVALGQAAVFGALLLFVAGRATPGGFGGPLQYWLAAADAARAAPVCDVRVLGKGASPVYDEIPAIFHVLLPGDARVNFVDARAPQWPANSALVVVPPGFDASDVAATQAEIALRPGEGAIVIASYPRRAAGRGDGDARIRGRHAAVGAPGDGRGRAGADAAPVPAMGTGRRAGRRDSYFQSRAGRRGPHRGTGRWRAVRGRDVARRRAL
jgi:hypothetical protein